MLAAAHQLILYTRYHLVFFFVFMRRPMIQMHERTYVCDFFFRFFGFALFLSNFKCLWIGIELKYDTPVCDVWPP